MRILFKFLIFPCLLSAQVDFDPDLMKERFTKSMTIDEPYKLTWLSKKRADVKEGKIIKKNHISEKFYPGVKRDYWIYIPSNYDKKKESNLIIFQDGEGYLFSKTFQAGTALDNMTHFGLIPQTIGVFINPGDKLVGEKNIWGWDTSNRSYEYDSIDEKYANFLVEEILPEIKSDYNITENPKKIVIGGISSGGICSFNAAWHRPDIFGNVISHCGSFTNIRGGDRYPQIVRQSKKKDIKVFLQGGENDLNLVVGSWPSKNKEMAESLEFREYEYKFIYGVGGHSNKHGGELFPETLIWLWSD